MPIHLKILAPALLPALLALSCGSDGTDPDAADADDLNVDVDAWDTSPDRRDTHLDSGTIPDVEADPPLGMCGAFCPGGDTCPEGAYCEYGVLDPTHMCTTNGCGFCVWIPDDCPPEDEPVCGCNGTVYDNACERRRDRAQPDIAWSSCPLPEPDSPEPDF